MSDYLITNYNRYSRWKSDMKMITTPTRGEKLSRNQKRKLAKVRKAERRRLNVFDKPKITTRPDVVPYKQLTPRNYYLYALLLENNMYYVGMTSYKDAKVRYQQHQHGKGAKWTRLHKPIEMIEVRNIGVCMEKTALEAENHMTRQYMEKYGMYNVRGGDLCFISPTLLAMRFDKTKLKTKAGKTIPKSASQARKMDQVQRDIAAELSWIT